MWPFKRQADRGEELRAELVEFLGHITDERAAADVVDMLQRLRHCNRILRADAETEAHR